MPRSGMVISSSEAGEWAPPSATGQLVYDTLSAHIHPQQATQALGRAVEELGGVITPAGARQGAIVDARGWRGDWWRCLKLWAKRLATGSKAKRPC